MTFNLSQNLSKIGTGLMQMGITYGISKESMRGGFGGGCGGGSIWNTGGCFGGGYAGGYGMSNMYMDCGMDPSLAAMAQMQAQQYGASAAHQDIALIRERLKTPDGEEVKKGTDKTAGAALEKDIEDNNTHNFVSNEWKDLNNKEERTQKEQAKLDKEYKTELTKLAKSFVAQVRKGDKGNITEEQYIKYFMKHHQKENPTEKDIQALKQAAANEFAALDLNESGVLDYKEIAAYINVLDKDDDDKVDGELSKENIQKVGEELVKSDNDEVRDKLKQSYNGLFGQQSSYWGGFGGYGGF